MATIGASAAMTDRITDERLAEVKDRFRAKAKIVRRDAGVVNATLAVELLDALVAERVEVNLCIEQGDELKARLVVERAEVERLSKALSVWSKPAVDEFLVRADELVERFEKMKKERDEARAEVERLRSALESDDLHSWWMNLYGDRTDMANRFEAERDDAWAIVAGAHEAAKLDAARNERDHEDLKRDIETARFIAEYWRLKALDGRSLDLLADAFPWELDQIAITPTAKLRGEVNGLKIVDEEE